MDALTEFVSIRSVSLPTYRDNCRQGAVWLAKHLAKLGAESKVVSIEAFCRPRISEYSQIETGIETNPHVLATFSGTQIPDNRLRKPRILFYG
jgi:acetylornithine deacetylase/succinyl-diaminopimelate desuccinylase-like protein